MAVVQMELSRILIRELNDYQIIELREITGDAAPANGQGAAPEEDESRSFPIVIGLPEAQAIERRLKGIAIKRPQTHDLLANVIQEMGGKLESITINKLEEHTFFATLNVKRADGQEVHIDSRPSDAIALGIAGGVPIYVDEQVLDSAMNEEL